MILTDTKNIWDCVLFIHKRSAELDASCARLDGLTRAELHYILNPQRNPRRRFPWGDIAVLKGKEVRWYGDAPQSDVKAGVGGVGSLVNGLCNGQIDGFGQSPFLIQSHGNTHLLIVE